MYRYEIHLYAESFRGGATLDRDWYEIESDISPADINRRIEEVVPNLGKQCGFECDQSMGECTCGYECAYAALIEEVEDAAGEEGR